MRDFKLPWHDSGTWTPGFWYPVPEYYYNPLPEFEVKSEKLGAIDGYGIFTLKAGTKKGDWNFGDYDPVFEDSFTFSQAITLCQTHNGEALLK